MLFGRQESEDLAEIVDSLLQGSMKLALPSAQAVLQFTESDQIWPHLSNGIALMW